MSNNIPFLSPIDLGQNPVVNFAFEALASAPASPVSFRMYGATATGYPMYWNSVKGAWRPTDAAGLSDGSISNAALAPIANTLLVTNPLLRSNHTGTQVSATISDFATAVQATALNLFALPTAPVTFGGYEIQNIAQAASATSAVRFDQMQTAIAQAVQGIKAWRDPVRCCVNSSSITPSGALTTAQSDGVSLNNGDRILKIGAGNATDGWYYYNSAGAWPRTSDCLAGQTVEEGTQTFVAEGSTYAGSVFRVTSSGLSQALGTATISFVQVQQANAYQGDNNTITLSGLTFSAKLDPAGGLTYSAAGLAINKSSFVGKTTAFTFTGDGSTTSWTLTHNLNNVLAEAIFRNASSQKVEIFFTNTSANAITVTFGQAPATNVTYTAAVLG